MDPSTNPPESSCKTTTQPTRRRRQVRLIPEPNLSPTTPSNMPPINSNPPSRSEFQLNIGKTSKKRTKFKKPKPTGTAEQKFHHWNPILQAQ